MRSINNSQRFAVPGIFGDECDFAVPFPKGSRWFIVERRARPHRGVDARRRYILIDIGIYSKRHTM
jgi:hypothetical protein